MRRGLSLKPSSRVAVCPALPLARLHTVSGAAAAAAAINKQSYSARQHATAIPSPSAVAAVPSASSSSLSARSLHSSPSSAAASFGLTSLVSSLSNGIMAHDDYFRNGVPPPRFCLSPASPPLAEIFAAHSSVDPFKEVAPELAGLNATVSEVLGTDHPLLGRLANYFFETKGKRVRPTIIFLMSRAMAEGVKEDSASASASSNHVDLHQDNQALQQQWIEQQIQAAEQGGPVEVHIGEKADAAASASSSRFSLSSSSSSSTAPFSNISHAQVRLAEVCEMIHTASLLHDDVIDEAATRRNVPSLNSQFGNKLAILGGDFLLARASISLARLGNPLVVELISTAIEHLVKGELMQTKPSLRCGSEGQGSGAVTAQAATASASGPFTTYKRGTFASEASAFFRPLPTSKLTNTAAASFSSSATSPATSSFIPSEAFSADLNHYLTKSYYKTASLLANSCRSAAILGGHPLPVQTIAYEFGKHLGLAFQVVDDLLDVRSNSAILGKPAMNDLASGVATAPLLFALRAFPQQVLPIVQRRGQQPGDVEAMREYMARAGALEKTQRLAEECAEAALAAVLQLKPSRAQSALVQLMQKVLTREK